MHQAAQDYAGATKLPGFQSEIQPTRDGIMSSEQSRLWQVVQAAPETPAVLAMLEGGQPRYAEDPRQPERELSAQLARHLAKVRVVVTVPCAASTLQTLLQQAPRLQAVLVVDNNAARLHLWRQAVYVPGDRRIQMLLLPEHAGESDLQHALGKLFLELLLGQCQVYIPRRFARLEPEFSHLLQAVTLAALQKAASYAVHLSLRSWRGTVNMLVNIQRAWPRRLRRRAAAVTAVTIVGAGPSLDKNVAALARYADRTVIISCDAALQTLLRHDIKPDIIVAHEDCSTCWRFFQQHLSALTDIPLLAPYRSSELLTRRYPGPVVLAPTGDEPDWLHALLPDAPAVADGSCVGHLAFNLASAFQPRMLIMIGFDLSFPNDQVHCRGMEASYWKDPKQIPNPVMIEGIDGRPVRTDQSFVYFREHFEQLIAGCAAEVVNATEGGARVAGAREATLASTLALLPPQCKPAVEVETLAPRAECRVLAEAINHIQHARQLLLDAQLQPQQLLDNPEHPLWQWLSGKQQPYSLLCDCADFMLRAEFRYAVQHWRKSGDDAELLLLLPRLFADFTESADLLLEAWQLPAATSNNRRTAVLFLQPADTELDTALLIEAAGRRPDLILPENTPLPAIWQAIRTHAVGRLVMVNGAATPVIWSPPDVACTDIKTRFEPRLYERNLWLSSYTLACAEPDLLRQWQNYVAADVSCQLLQAQQP